MQRTVTSSTGGKIYIGAALVDVITPSVKTTFGASDKAATDTATLKVATASVITGTGPGDEITTTGLSITSIVGAKDTCDEATTVGGAITPTAEASDGDGIDVVPEGPAEAGGGKVSYEAGTSVAIGSNKASKAKAKETLKSSAADTKEDIIVGGIKF